MPSTLLSLAQWARALRLADIPDDVLRLARLQHIAAAGASRASVATPAGAALADKLAPGSAAVAGGRTADPLAAAQLHAGLTALHDYDDYLLAGRASLALVPTVWASAAGHTVDELLIATIVGNEIGGRIGLALLLGPRHTRTDTFVPAAAAAAAAAWLAGLDADGIGRAVSIALQQGKRLTPTDTAADPAAVGARTVRAAMDAVGRSRTEGSLDLLDEHSPFYGPLSKQPLLGAYGGLGQTWLTRTLVIKPEAVMAWAGVAVQGVHEILKRHVKASDKRLRAEQVERIEVRVGLLPWAMDHASAGADVHSPVALAWSLKRAIGVLVARHELTPAVLTPEALAEKATEIEHVASRVEVVHDWALSVSTLEGFTRVLGPLFAGLSPMELRQVRTRLKEAGGWPQWHRQDLWPILRARPDRVVRNLQAPSGDLGEIDLTEFRWQLPIEIKLYTTRGGWWPERRALPLGSVATGDIEAVALAKHGGADAAALAATEGSTDGSAWVKGLLA
ncbi:MAG: MmgE/PrpD family protein [Pseudomonadota bacterium]|nr:MmgE/PrpD family protein [Pseudomonadota bacterium]